MEHLWPGSPLVFVLAWFGWRLANKAGYSGLWGLTAIIPPLGLVMLWVLAAQKDWPRDRMVTPAGPATTPRPREDAAPGGIVVRRPGTEVTRP